MSREEPALADNEAFDHLSESLENEKQGFACFPFGSQSYNCCTGKLPGEKCTIDGECKGASTCFEGECVGQVLCEKICHELGESKDLNCCVNEKKPIPVCETSLDCLGARNCNPATKLCEGKSKCSFNAARSRTTIYDTDCICIESGTLCQFRNGIPCKEGCKYSYPAGVLDESLVVCGKS